MPSLQRVPMLVCLLIELNIKLTDGPAKSGAVQVRAPQWRKKPLEPEENPRETQLGGAFEGHRQLRAVAAFACKFANQKPRKGFRRRPADLSCLLSVRCPHHDHGVNNSPASSAVFRLGCGPHYKAPHQ